MKTICLTNTCLQAYSTQYYGKQCRENLKAEKPGCQNKLLILCSHTVAFVCNFQLYYVRKTRQIYDENKYHI